MSTPSDDELYDIAANVTVEYPLCLPGSAMGKGIRERAERRALYEAGYRKGKAMGAVTSGGEAWDALADLRGRVDWLLTADAEDFLNDQEVYGTAPADILAELHARITGTEENGDG